jgi:AcrR family transcriptional regulator
VPKVTEAYRDERRRELIDAARTCFARNGFAATSMQEIFEEAGISAGGFYRYFSSKTELVAAIAEETASRLEAVVARAAEEAETLPDFAARLIDGVAEIDRERDQGTVAIQVWAEAAKDAEIRAVVLQLTRRALEHVAAFTGSTDTARVLIATAQGFLLQRSWNRRLDSRAFARSLAELLERRP